MTEGQKIQQLIIRYYNGEDVLRELYNIYYKKFLYVARNNYDLVSDLNFTLAKCLDKYDVNNGVAFNTYFWTAWHNQQGCTNKYRYAKKRTDEHGQNLELSLNKQVNFDGTKIIEFGDLIDDNRQVEEMQKLINRIAFYDFLKKSGLTKKEKFIVTQIYKGYPQNEIAKKLNCTPANITAILKQMARKPYAQKLYEFLVG